LDFSYLNALIDAWTHGPKGFLLGYVLIAVFSLAGLMRGKASLLSGIPPVGQASHPKSAGRASKMRAPAQRIRLLAV